MAFPIDGEDQSADFKKPPEGRASTSKRTRTAEVHNRSERVGLTSFLYVPLFSDCSGSVLFWALFPELQLLQ